MWDYIELDTVPVEEPCVQVGEKNYMERMLEECKQFIELLRKKFGPEPEGARLSIKSFPHDFGSYLEVVCYFDTDNPESMAYAFCIGENLPLKWDDDSPVDWRKNL